MNSINSSKHIEDLIEVYLADGLSQKERAEFEAHCSKCESCNKALEQAREFEVKVFQSLVPDKAPADLEERLVDSFRTEVLQPARRSRMKAHRTKDKSRSFFSALYHTKLLRLISVPIAALLLIIIGTMMMPGMNKEGIIRTTNLPFQAPKMLDMELPQDVIETTLSREISSDQDPVWKNAEISEHNETADVDVWHLDKGKSYDFMSDKPLRGKGIYEKVGVAGGPGGRYGGPRGGRVPPGDKLVWGDIATKSKFPPKLSSSSEKMDTLRESLTAIMETGMAYVPDDITQNTKIKVGTAPSVSALKLLDPTRKIIKSGTLTFEVESFETAYQQVVAILTEEKGYIASSSTTKLPNGKIRGHIVIRVLPERFDNVTLKLRALGELKNRNITSEDITKKYIDLQARLKNARAMEERLIKLMSRKRGEVKDLLMVEKELDKTREKIERFQGEMKYYDNLIALATLRLEIFEKDIGKPFEYVQTQSANLSLAVADVLTAYYQAQAMVHDLKGQMVEARLTDQNKRARGTVKAYVDAEQFAGLLEQLKGLGEVKSAVVGQRQTSSSGTPSTDKDTPVRKERGLVNLTLNPPAGEYIQTKNAKIVLKSTDVNTAYTKAQDIATETQAKILNGNLNRGTDQTTATLVCQIEAERFRTLVDSLKGIGEVTSATMEEHQTARGIDPKSNLQAPIRKEPGLIELVIISPAPIVSKEGGIGATFKKTLKGSFGGLLWSLEMLVVGLATVGLWLVLLILVIILVRRYLRGSAKKGSL